MRIMRDGEVIDAPDALGTEAGAAAARIEELKAFLSATDYRTLKYVEGELTEEEFALSSVERAAWRAEINALEAAE